MNSFLLVFRTDQPTLDAMPQRSPEEMQANASRWMEWIDGITAQNKLTQVGNRLSPLGKVVKTGQVIADGPYVEIKECIVGYTIVGAATLEEAAELVIGCPILAMGGSVEVREIASLYP